jgi:hypothetical protein
MTVNMSSKIRGFHHPDAVVGLIYLEAGNRYALYDQIPGQIMLMRSG